MVVSISRKPSRIQKSIVNPEIHRESIIFSTIHFYPGQSGPPTPPSAPPPGLGGRGRVGLARINIDCLKNDVFAMGFWICDVFLDFMKILAWRDTE